MSDPGQAYEKSNVIAGSFGATLQSGNGGDGNEGLDRRVTRLELQQELVARELSSISAKIDVMSTNLSTAIGSINTQIARLPSFWGLWSALGVMVATMLAVLAIVISVFQYKTDLATLAAPATGPAPTVIVLPPSVGVPSFTIPEEPKAEQPAP